MPLITMQAAIFIIGVVTLGSGAWLLVHARDVARLFRREPDIAVGPGRKQASKATTWTMLAVFNAGWIIALVFWSLTI
ncbi:hypothetical protein [Erythrobacter sp. HL-111]|uniref:hypothetical protein n=1 Tax=Erythrobacter sp. HL-111 TaxID=1798193 RepID=UPI0006DA4BDC|nr:hypothetical protein [Erythrobacter sp. HL-111]KPP82471.1 MAG: hypothetical protein HLUCCO15_14320 [Erythrobacteraceae bacterium HL-111]SDS84369.1 hypothetical protein SAMN04515621_2347 [Erythrobacter sp. HL-111]